LPSGALASLPSLEAFINSLYLKAKAKCHELMLEALETKDSDSLLMSPEAFKKNVAMPLLKIGFEDWFVDAFFHSRNSPWRALERLGKDTVVFEPKVETQMKEVRRTVLSILDKKEEDRQALEGYEAVFGLWGQGANRPSEDQKSKGLPATSYPWIILPRAFVVLEKNNSLIFVCYTNALRRENTLPFIKILSRIIIEFVGNFTLKYASGLNNVSRLGEALVYGYSAMFWKNLLTPPPGLQDLMMFENFFRMAKAIQHRYALQNDPLLAMISQMGHVRSMLFWKLSLQPLPEASHSYGVIMPIALRHGTPGIQSCIRFFGLGPALFKNRTPAGLPYSDIPRQLQLFLRELGKRWDEESEITKKSARIFLERILQMYDKRHLLKLVKSGQDHRLPFIGAWVRGLVSNFAPHLN